MDDGHVRLRWPREPNDLPGGWGPLLRSREETEARVHVHHETGEAKTWFEPEIAVAENYGPANVGWRQPCGWRGSTRMRSGRPGRRTFAAEVTNVSSHGLRVLLDARELLLSFELFPWFREAPIGQGSSPRAFGPDRCGERHLT
jgi:hypothetical protein